MLEKIRIIIFPIESKKGIRERIEGDSLELIDQNDKEATVF